MRSLITAVGVIMAVGGAVPSFAQATAATPDTMLIIISPRAAADIEADLQNAKAVAGRSGTAYKAAQSLYETAATRVEMQKKEVEAIKAKIDLAKKEKKDTQLVTLEAERRAAEQLRSVYERERDLRRAEADHAEAEGEHAEAASKAYQLEAELARKRAEAGAPVDASATDRGTMLQVLRELEGRTLEAQLEMAKKTEKHAEKEKTLVERRLALFKAQTKA